MWLFGVGRVRSHHDDRSTFHGATLGPLVDNDPPPGFSTDLQAVSAYIIAQRDENEHKDTGEDVPEELTRNIYDSADLEAYDQPINPLDFAQTVDEAHRPRKQNCTICSDIFVPRSVKAVCLKIRGCGQLKTRCVHPSLDELCWSKHELVSRV